MSELKPLDPQQLIHACDGGCFDFDDSSQLEAMSAIVGQERALEAIDFGTRMQRSGYNLYVMGSTGVGKHWTLERALQARVADTAAPSDWCYVAAFAAPDRPQALELPAGRGRELRHDVQQLVEDLLNAIPAAFQNDEYRRRAQEIQDEFKQREEETAEALAHKASERNIALLHTPTGYSLAPLHDGKMLSPPEFDALDKDERQRLETAMGEIKEELRKVLGRIPLWQREMRQRFQALDRDVTQLTVDQLIHGLLERYQDLPEVLAYLQAVRADAVENAAAFRPQGESEVLSAENPRFTRYRVNLLVDNAECAGAPIVFADNPNYQNLVGRIEHIARMGMLMTDFTLIKPGVLHKANGGYLVLDVIKVLTQPFAWDALKRALNGNEIKIEPLERMVGFAGTVSLEPEPIPLQIKVALVGERLLYYLLKAYDPEFGALFKVAVDFEEELPRSADQDLLYARLIASLQQQQALRPLQRAAICRVIEWAGRRVGDGERLSLHIGSLLDLLQEADYFAGSDARQIDADAVQRAIAAQEHRVDQLRERLHEAILRDQIMIDTDGWQLAQVNGLAVLQAGDYSFGSPIRISATARLGNGEVVDIERETNLGGDIHAKGVLILSAYLAARYARHQPLSVSASLVFEQSYGMVEGDSASVAELCALLSAIGDLSVNQAFAVTGSVNQHGEVQAIGGVNEKIEGFFDICSRRGRTGQQGVIIPRSNVENLMLRADVRQAVADGEFRIFAAAHIDEVMQLLTGLPAGHPDANGLYAANTVNGHVQSRLFEWTAVRQHYSASGGPVQ